MGNQTRTERWEAGLLSPPVEVPERQLDICLMKQTRRMIYRGGYLQFENLTYQNDALAAYAGDAVVLRYDPRDITTVLVYHQEIKREASEYESSEQHLKWIKEVFLSPAHAQDLEREQISLDEAKAMSRSIRQAGKAIDNQSMRDEFSDREAFITQKKKNRRDRQKQEQATIQTLPEPVKSIEPAEPQPEPSPQQLVEVPTFEIWDFDED